MRNISYARFATLPMWSRQIEGPRPLGVDAKLRFASGQCESVIVLEPEPDILRDARRVVQAQRKFRRDALVPPNECVDRLMCDARPVREFELAYAQLVDHLSQELAGRNRHVGLHTLSIPHVAGSPHQGPRVSADAFLKWPYESRKSVPR